MRRKHEIAAYLTDSDWFTKLLYLHLSGIFEKINSLNLSLRDKSIDILTVDNKIYAFKKKIQHWAGRVESGRVDMFPELNDFSQ